MPFRLGPPSCISHHQQHMAGLPLVAGVSVLLGCLASCTALPGHLGVEPPAGSTTAFSVPLCVAAGKLPRRDGAVVTTAINFTQLLAGASTEGSVAADSLRVSEAGKHVSFQFDPVTDYDAAHNAAGELVLLLSGETAAGASRNITVSFGSTKVLNPTTPLVNVSTRCDDEGEACLLISTHAQAWKYQLLGGAFSSLLGPDGKNWISYKPSGGSNGSYRGVPNLYNGKDRAGGSCCLHPGDNNSRTAMLRGGRDAPIRVRLESTVANNTAGHAGDWRVWWDIYPEYATVSVKETPAGAGYWFMYEATPHGAIVPDSQYMYQPDGTKLPLSQRWDKALGEEDYVVIADPPSQSSIFLVHHEGGALNTEFWPMNGQMTVMGFGRKNLDQLFHGPGHSLSLGIVQQGLEFPAMQQRVRGIISPPTCKVGLVEL